MKYLYNPATDEFESLTPTLRDRFALGGGVIQGEKVGDRENFLNPVLAVPFIPAGMVTSIASLLGVAATGQAITTYLQNNPSAIDTVKKALEMSGKMTGILPFGTKPGEQPEIEEELKELSKPKGFPGKAPDMPKSEGTKIPEPKKQDAPINKPPEIKPLKGFPDQSEEIDTSILYNKPTSEDEMSIIRNQFGTYKIKKSEDKRNIKTKVPEPKDGITFSDFRTKLTKEPNLLKDIAKKYDKNKFYNTKDLFNIFGVTTKKGNPKANEYFTGELKKSGVQSRLISSGGRGQEYKLKDVINFFKKNPKTVGLGRTQQEIVDDRNKAEDRLDKDLYDFNKRVIKNIRETAKAEDVYIPTKTLSASAGDHIGHPVSVKVTDKKEFKKLLKNSNINKINSLVFQDAEINMNTLNRETGYDVKFNTYFKQLNKFLNKPITEKNQAELIKIKDDMDNHYIKAVNTVNELTEENEFFKGQEERIPKVTINIPEVGSKFKSSDLFADMSTVDPDYRYGKIQEINPDAIKFSDLSKEEKEIFTQNIYNQYSDNLNTFYKDAGIAKEDVEDFSEFIETGGVKEMTGKKNILSKEYMAEGGRITGKLNLPKMDQTMMAAQGGRVGFQDGTPNPIFDQVIASLDNTDLINNLEEENKQTLKEEIYGDDGERNLIQTFNTMFADPEAYPYYAQELASGGANIPELAVRFPTALAYLFGKTNLAISTADPSKIGMKDLKKAAEIMNPKYTKSVKDKIGFTDMLEESRAERTGPQKTMGSLLEFGAESVGPATPYFLIKAFPKIAKQVRNLVGTAASAEKVNKEIENKMVSQGVDQTRRDILLATGAGGAMALLKFLGLDNLVKTTKVAKAAPEIITSGGTPKYFFDFVNLIKKKGKDVSEEASTVAREKVYDYNGYTLYEKLDTGEIRIGKETEGGGSYYIGDGEFENIDGIIKREEVTYTPKETIIEDGKSVEVKDTYDEATLKPDRDGNEGDFEAGLESIDEILELLSKDGKTYSKEDLLKMGIDPDGLKNYSTGAGSIPEGRIGEANPFKPKKAGGGIMKLAGDDSGPPPKSGPTPHGLPYVAKNVRPIKERK